MKVIGLILISMMTASAHAELFCVIWGGKWGTQNQVVELKDHPETSMIHQLDVEISANRTLHIEREQPFGVGGTHETLTVQILRKSTGTVLFESYAGVGPIADADHLSTYYPKTIQVVVGPMKGQIMVNCGLRSADAWVDTTPHGPVTR